MVQVEWHAVLSVTKQALHVQVPTCQVSSLMAAAEMCITVINGRLMRENKLFC